MRTTSPERYQPSGLSTFSVSSGPFPVAAEHVRAADQELALAGTGHVAAVAGQQLDVGEEVRHPGDVGRAVAPSGSAMNTPGAASVMP